jgi:hypothetical protein
MANPQFFNRYINFPDLTVGETSSEVCMIFMGCNLGYKKAETRVGEANVSFEYPASFEDPFGNLKSTHKYIG